VSFACYYFSNSSNKNPKTKKKPAQMDPPQLVYFPGDVVVKYTSIEEIHLDGAETILLTTNSKLVWDGDITAKLASCIRLYEKQLADFYERSKQIPPANSHGKHFSAHLNKN
jgi:hypothetical protein